MDLHQGPVGVFRTNLFGRYGVDLYAGYRALLHVHIQPLTHRLDVRSGVNLRGPRQLLPAIGRLGRRIPRGARWLCNGLLHLRAHCLKDRDTFGGNFAWR